MDSNNRAFIDFLNDKLVRAASFGQVEGPEGIQELIRLGAEVNTQAGSYSPTPLMAAAQNGHAQAVQSLLGLGANPNLGNSFGNTALMSATVRGHSDVVRALLEGRASFTSPNLNGKSAIQFAIDHHREGYVAQFVLSEIQRASQTVAQPSMDRADDYEKATQEKTKRVRT